MNALARTLIGIALPIVSLSGVSCHLFRSKPPLGDDPLPLAKGATWKYKAKVSAYNTETEKVETRTFDWTTKVEEERYGAGVIGYVVSGWPTDIDDQSAGTPAPSKTMILRAGEFFLFSAGAVTDAEPTLDSAERWFRVPLFESDSVCPDDGAWSNGTLYCWVVTKEGPKSRRYNITFRSGPDDITYTLEPGRGLVKYHYEHHGSTNTVDLQLVSYKPGS